MSVLLKTGLALLGTWSTLSFAGGDYADNPATLALIDELVQEQAFDRAQLMDVFADAERKESIIKAMSRPAEKSKPWYDYRKIFITGKRERQGLDFYAQHRETLQRAEREMGVPAELVVAILGVETYYGRITGSYRVIDALSTLAFDFPRRATFFTKELKNYLILSREQELDPLVMKGSYAGAMGYGQFMPSSYRAYAIDFDGDGKVDIWNNPVDAIGSVANYFKHHGWQAGEPVVFPAQVTESVSEDVFNNSLKPGKTVREFAEAGVSAVAEPTLPPDTMATAMKFETEGGYEYWLGLHNFYVITRYNHSSMYAMCVYQLSQLLAAQVGE